MIFIGIFLSLPKDLWYWNNIDYFSTLIISIVERGADGVRVIYWYHRQFIEAAYDRYCLDETTRKKHHLAVAEYFMGKWSNGMDKNSL